MEEKTSLATPQDAEALAALHAACFGSSHWNLAQIRNALQAPTTLALVAEGVQKPVGFIVCQLVAPEAEIVTFCVSPKKRKQGIGALLLAKALEILREKKVVRLFLEVAADNVAAQALYEKAGFKITGKRERYYKRPSGSVDALMMALDL